MSIAQVVGALMLIAAFAGIVGWLVRDLGWRETLIVLGVPIGTTAFLATGLLLLAG